MQLFRLYLKSKPFEDLQVIDFVLINVCIFLLIPFYHYLNTLSCQSLPKYLVCIDHQSLNKHTVGRKTYFFMPTFSSNGEKLWDYQQKIYQLKIWSLRWRLTSLPGMLCTCPLILLTLVFPVSASVLIWKMIIVTKSFQEVCFRCHFFRF